MHMCACQSREKKRNLSSLVIFCLIFSSSFSFSSSVSEASGGNREKGIWVYTYLCNEATNKSIDIFFELFNINFTRTSSISTLGSALVIVLGANMTSAPDGLKDKIRGADFCIVLAIGAQDVDYTVPQDIAQLFGFQYDVTDLFYDSYGSIYSDSFIYEVSYCWNYTLQGWRNLEVDLVVRKPFFGFQSPEKASGFPL